MIFVRGVEGKTLRGPEFLARVGHRYGVYLYFYPADVNLCFRLDMVAKRFTKHDLFHMGKTKQPAALEIVNP